MREPEKGRTWPRSKQQSQDKPSVHHEARWRTHVAPSEGSSRMPDIMHLVKIHASPAQVYQAITTAEGVRNWWTRDTALDSKIGGTGEFGFNDHQFVIKVKIDELTPQTHVGWKMISSGLPAFDGTTIAFDLRAKDGDTITHARATVLDSSENRS